MSDFIGINQFGSLTSTQGKKLTFKDFDQNNDGKISTEEYNAVLKETKLDTVELSSVDTNGDKTISEDEFKTLEQKIEMQEVVNGMSRRISIDFAGKSEHIETLTTQLKEYIETFAADNANEADMVGKFKGQIGGKYEALKAELLKNDPETITSKVLDEIFANLTDKATKGVEIEGYDDNIKKRLGKELNNEATKFIKEYKGDNLETDLRTHLENFMSKSDVDKLGNAVADFQNGLSTLGDYLDNQGDLRALKEYAKDLLQTAVDANVPIKIGTNTIRTTAAINTVLNKFNDATQLKDAINEAIKNLSSETLLEKITSEEQVNAQKAVDQKFTDIKGSAYQANTGILDYSGIEGYNDPNYLLRTKGKRGNYNKIRNQAENIIETNLKEQIKSQIKDMLESKGIPFDKIETIFENVWSTTMTETLEGIDIHKTNHKLRNKKKTYASNDNIKTIVDNFVTKFNANITKSIDDMNKSNKDMDIIDIDFTKADKDTEYHGRDLNNTYAYNQTLYSSLGKVDEHKDLAKKMIENLKPQLLEKAKTMCKNNNIQFDEKAFDAIFNNAQMASLETTIEKDMVFGIIPHSKFNARTTLNTFVQEFQKNYTDWVNKEK